MLRSASTEVATIADLPESASSQVRAVILLAGGSGLEQFDRIVGRSVLMLPLGTGESLGTFWQHRIASLAGQTPLNRVRMRVVGGAPFSGISAEDGSNPMAVEHVQDPQELRGTGGVLRDITASYPPDAYVLVSNASLLLLEPLGRLLDGLFQTGADVAFYTHKDDSASNLMLIRCGSLRAIPEVGYIDLKEQALPRIAGAQSVTVIRRETPIGVSLRTPAEYIRGLRIYQQHLAGQEAIPGRFAGHRPFDEDWQPIFEIVEPGAMIGPGVRLHDAVVLGGARVGRNAVILRSLICPGAVVPANATIVDQVVKAGGLRSSLRQTR